ncbi:DMT family transporter [Gracilimonas tropica]|uniref:DMT family transporter n=1 Tax=Gracilimonas tropica TaxID=454600 RepID=UPI00037EC71B|nr:DMT family transporter [Gracilimonas tropica]
MNYLAFVILALVGGVFLAAQGGFNTQLGVLLNNPLLASAVAYIVSTTFALGAVLVSVNEYPSLNEIRSIPAYLWFTGALLSLIGITLYYYTIPKLGISTMISLGLCGQLIFSVIAGHFGWFNLPVEPADFKRILGVIIMITGILLINSK